MKNENIDWTEKLWEWADENLIHDSILPRNKDDLMKITSLSIGYNWIPEFIDIGDNNSFNRKINSIPKELGNLINLKKLTLYSFESYIYHKEVLKLVNLEELTIEEHDNDNIDILKNITNLKKLNFLSITNNNLTELPNELFKLDTLITLKLFLPKVEKIDKRIGDLVNLTKLTINAPKLKTVPKEIGKLIHLVDLCIANTKIKKLPIEIFNLKELNEVLMTHNKFKFIPKEIGNLLNLQFLYLDANELVELPDEISNLEKLEDFTFSNNKFIDTDKIIKKYEKFTLRCRI